MSDIQQFPETPSFEGQPVIKTQDGRNFPVPPEGSLGLLALGYKGIMLWRESRAAAKKAGVWKNPALLPDVDPRTIEIDPDIIDPTMM